MKTIPKHRLEYFAELMKKHWPEVTNLEIAESAGEFDRVLSVVQTKTMTSAGDPKRTLEMVFKEVTDHQPDEIPFAGIDRVQHEPPAPKTNEWQAREDE